MTRDISLSSHKEALVGKIKQAYLTARTQFEVLEVELNRSKIRMRDKHGKLIKISILSEH